jgi:hypothetical protein
MCIFDLTILWGIAGTALGFMGYRIYKSYKDTKNKPNDSPSKDKDKHTVSAE